MNLSMTELRAFLALALLTCMAAAAQANPEKVNMSKLTDQTVARVKQGKPDRHAMIKLAAFYRARAAKMTEEVEQAKAYRQERRIARPTAVEEKYEYFLNMADLFDEACVVALAIEQAPFVPKPPTEEEMVQNRVSLRRIALQISARHAKSPFKKRAS